MTKRLPEKHRWRFFHDAPLVPGTEIDLSESEAHFAQVLRLRPGELIELTDGRGTIAPASLVRMERHQTRVLIDECLMFPRQNPWIDLVVGVSKPAALEESVESAVQMGVDRITFVETAKSVRFRSESLGSNDRMKRIVKESCRISKRPWLCELVPGSVPLEQIVVGRSGPIFVCDEAPLHDLVRPSGASAEEAPAVPLHPTLLSELQRLGKDKAPGSGPQDSRVTLVIGPESGFLEAEKQELQLAAKQQGVPLVFVSLGQQILTVPNAVRAAVAVTAALLRDR